MHIDPEQQQSPVAQGRVAQTHSIVRRLRSLPQEIQQPYDWAEFRRRERELAVSAARGDEINRRFAAVAAALVLAVVGIATWVHIARPNLLASIVGHHAPAGNTAKAAAEGAGSDPGAADRLDARADTAERWLASLPNEPGVVRVGTRAVVTGLEDRIAQLDDYLSAARIEGVQPARLADVEEQRARLVRSLVQVRYAETLVSASR